MTLSELKIAVREMLDDEKAPYLWSDAQLTRAANVAVKEACVRARLIFDSSSSIAVVAGTTEYRLPTNMFYTQDVFSVTAAEYLAKAGIEDIIHKGWDTETGTPTHYLLDYRAGYVRLYPNPIATDTLVLTGMKTPSYDMEVSTDEPEIDEIHHEGLTLWMCHQLYNRADLDESFQGEAARYLDLFTAQFGTRPNAQMMTHQKKYRRFRVPGRYV